MNPETSGVNTGRAIFNSGDPAYVNGLSVEQWSMQSFLSEGASGFWHIEANLLLENNRLVGEVQNNSNYDLKDVS